MKTQLSKPARSKARYTDEYKEHPQSAISDRQRLEAVLPTGLLDTGRRRKASTG